MKVPEATVAARFLQKDLCSLPLCLLTLMFLRLFMALRHRLNALLWELVGLGIAPTLSLWRTVAAFTSACTSSQRMDKNLLLTML